MKESTGQLKTGLSLKSRSALLEASPGFGRCFKNTVSLQSISQAQTVNNLLMPFCRIFLKTCHPHYLLAAVSHYSRWKMLYLSVRLVLCNFSPLTQESTQARGNKMQSGLFFFLLLGWLIVKLLLCQHATCQCWAFLLKSQEGSGTPQDPAW